MNLVKKYILDWIQSCKSIILQLQILIASTNIKLELRHKWRPSYYYLHENPFSFLNVTKGYADIGIRVGAHLNHIVSENWNVMKSFRYPSIKEIDAKIKVLLEILINKSALPFNTPSSNYKFESNGDVPGWSIPSKLSSEFRYKFK